MRYEILRKKNEMGFWLQRTQMQNFERSTTFLIEKGVYMEEEQQQAKLAIVIIKSQNLYVQPFLSHWNNFLKKAQFSKTSSNILTFMQQQNISYVKIIEFQSIQ